MEVDGKHGKPTSVELGLPGAGGWMRRSRARAAGKCSGLVKAKKEVWGWLGSVSGTRRQKEKGPRLVLASSMRAWPTLVVE